MTGSNRGWLVAFVVAVFLAGTSVGVIVDRMWLLRDSPRGFSVGFGFDNGGRVMGRGGAMGRGDSPADANAIVDANMRRLQSRLELTSDQATRIRPIIDAWQQRIAGLQRTTRDQLLAETAVLQDQVSEVLTPDQRERLSSARDWLLVPSTGRGGRGGGRGPGRPGGQGRE
jgi:hypothetical protein